MLELPIGRNDQDLSSINLSGLQEDPQDLRDDPVIRALKCAKAISLLATVSAVGFFAGNKSYEWAANKSYEWYTGIIPEETNEINTNALIFGLATTITCWYELLRRSDVQRRAGQR